MTPSLLDLPTDVLLHYVLPHLDLGHLALTATTCRAWHALVQAYFAKHSRPYAEDAFAASWASPRLTDWYLKLDGNRNQLWRPHFYNECRIAIQAGNSASDCIYIAEQHTRALGPPPPDPSRRATTVEQRVSITTELCFLTVHWKDSLSHQARRHGGPYPLLYLSSSSPEYVAVYIAPTGHVDMLERYVNTMIGPSQRRSTVMDCLAKLPTVSSVETMLYRWRDALGEVKDPDSGELSVDEKISVLTDVVTEGGAHPAAGQYLAQLEQSLGRPAQPVISLQDAIDDDNWAGMAYGLAHSRRLEDVGIGEIRQSIGRYSLPWEIRMALLRQAWHRSEASVFVSRAILGITRAASLDGLTLADAQWLADRGVRITPRQALAFSCDNPRILDLLVDRSQALCEELAQERGHNGRVYRPDRKWRRFYEWLCTPRASPALVN